MKNRVHKIAGVLLIGVIYLNALVWSVPVEFSCGAVSDSGRKLELPAPPPAIFMSASDALAGFSLKIVQELKVPFPYFTSYDGFASLKTNQRTFALEFSSYTAHIENFPVKFQKYDIPFPFHTFW